MRGRKSFTLLELLLVIIIIAVVSAFAGNRYLYIVERARAREAVGMLAAICASQAKYAIENNSAYASVFSQLDMALSAGAATKYFTINLDASGSPADEIKQRVAYMTRNSTLRLGGMGSYSLSACENGKIYCTDGTAGDCVTLNLGTSSSSCP